MEKGKILVFARAPIPGKCKTRLAPALGDRGAARLHARLIHQTLNNVTATDNVEVELWCTHDIAHPFFTSCAEHYGVVLHKQRGSDLGERMNGALTDALDRAPWAILVGTDCPELKLDDLEQAVTHLRRGMHAVLGPATDGGYVLIGLRQSAPCLFTDMPWGSNQVADLTRERMQVSGMCWRELPARNDIDHPGDLIYLNCL